MRTSCRASVIWTELLRFLRLRELDGPEKDCTDGSVVTTRCFGLFEVQGTGGAEADNDWLLSPLFC